MTFFLISLYRSWYLKKIKLNSIVLLFGGILFFLLLTYPIGDYFYKKSMYNRIDEFHSYLQLSPTEIQNIDTTMFNIFCLGGSTTEFKDQNGRDWPSIVEKNLREKSGLENVRIYNQGKQWYTSQHSVINYIENIQKYRPDMLIIMHNINDLLQNADFSRFSGGKFREDYGNFYGPITKIIKYGTFGNFILEVIRSLWYQPEIEEIHTQHFPGFIPFERNIKTLIRLAKDSNTKVVLLTQPNIYKDSISSKEIGALTMLNKEAIGNGKKWSYKTALSGIRQYNDKIREISEEEDIYLIDLEETVPKSLEYFYDDVHYQSKTFDLIASTIAQKIIKKYFL
jgi:lysophospholipase L1-like esterase